MSLSDLFVWAGLAGVDVLLYFLHDALGFRLRWIALITAVLFLVGLLTSQWARRHIWGARKRKREERATARAAEEAAREAEKAAFDSFPAELGIVDHGVNTVASIQELMDLLRRVLPHVANIFQCLFQDTPAKLPVGIAPAKKQQVLKQAAEHLRGDVLALEEIVPNAKAHVDTFKEAYRAVFRLPIQTPGDRESLRGLRATYADGVATSFRQFANLAEQRCNNIRRFQGNQQDLNRVVTRASAALDQLVAATRDLATFCTDEMAHTIDRLLATQDPA